MASTTGPSLRSKIVALSATCRQMPESTSLRCAALIERQAGIQVVKTSLQVAYATLSVVLAALLVSQVWGPMADDAFLVCSNGMQMDLEAHVLSQLQGRPSFSSVDSCCKASSGKIMLHALCSHHGSILAGRALPGVSNVKGSSYALPQQELSLHPTHV